MAVNTHHQPLLTLDSPKTSSKSFCLIFSIVALLCSATLLTSIHLTKTDSSSSNNSPPPLQGICDHAHDVKASCLALVSELSTNTTIETNHMNLLDRLLMDSAFHIEKTIVKAKLVRLKINDHREQQALADCLGLMELSIDRIQDSMGALRSVGAETDAHTWLSTVLTNHITCQDGLTGQAKSAIEPELNDLTLRARTSLAVLVSTYKPPTPKEDKSMLFPLKEDFPSWVTRKDRKLLWASANDINANVVVAQDGSGKYKTVKEAIASAPDNSKTRYVIYVKKGTYKENVEVGKTKKNLMLTGDGMSATIITGSLNVVDGSTTFNSATLAAVGDGFIAQDIWFKNTAGPQKHQAVALRVGADQAVINRCQIDAYQDTLYAHSNRQFYRDSYITGTVDFIFGNAAVVFQNCKLVARKPMTGQSNMVTAQGREDPNQNTGTSIQKCNVIASSDLAPVKGSIRSYLGRPWKAYSRTVYMQSYIGDHIDATGWSVWDGDFALKTLYYGEYSNNGPGSSTSGRVKWAGYHVITSAADAQKFTVAQLIQGGSWLAPSGVTFSEGL